jgi:hypothetical protein
VQLGVFTAACSPYADALTLTQHAGCLMGAVAAAPAGDSSLLRMGEKLAGNLEQLFEGVEVRPAVLHGDLWSGNMAAVDGKPAIFDPATYYGHHEAEFGMSWCAGGWGWDGWQSNGRLAVQVVHGCGRAACAARAVW